MSRNHQRGGRAVDAEDVGIILAIRAEQDGDDLCVVKVPLREKRTQWPIRHARCEDFLFARTAFALEIAAGELADRRRFLTVIDR